MLFSQTFIFLGQGNNLEWVGIRNMILWTCI